MINDFLYIFNFAPANVPKAIKRLRCSIESIRRQSIYVKIAVSNNSQEDIYPKLKDLDIANYIHKPDTGLFSRAQTINFGVRNLVTSDYFFVSDIDLIYQPHHIETIYNDLEKYDEPIRYIFWNYNIRKEEYSTNYEALMKLPHSGGGAAGGNGLIHLESFIKIQGYDEEMIGYSPEDDLFNQRIGKINKLIYNNKLATAHLFHPRFNMIQHAKNMEIYHKKLKILAKLPNPSIKDIKANINIPDWGII